jgi:xylulokinase
VSSQTVLGIDLGTTRTKVGLFTAEGEPLGWGRADQEMTADPSGGIAEQDPESWWRGVRSAIREALDGAASTTGAATMPDAVAVAGHGPSLVAVDAAGHSVRPAIMWLDTRSGTERDALEAASGLRGWALGVLPAALWLERHEPDAAANACWYLNAWEAIALRMTGRASTTLVPGGDPLPLDRIAGTGLHLARIAPPATTGTALGGLTARAARDLGLLAGTPVVAGLVDAFASFHGAGMVRAGDAIDVGGAAGGFGVYVDRPVEVAGGFTTPAPMAGLFSVGGAMAATGASLDWLARDILGDPESISILIDEAVAIEPGAEGLVFLPYLAGERSPIWDPTARGVFAGLTLRHSRAHLTRAVLEAAALAIRHVAQPMLAAGIEVRAMRACGGPARSAGWNRIKADITGFPVEVPRVRETAALGAAIVAAVGMGLHADLRTAIAAMTAVEERLEPDAQRHAIYDGVYAAYTSLHPAVAPVLNRAAAAA